MARLQLGRCEARGQPAGAGAWPVIPPRAGDHALGPASQQLCAPPTARRRRCYRCRSRGSAAGKSALGPAAWAAMGALASLLVVLLAGTTMSERLVVRAVVHPRNLTSEPAVDVGAAQPGVDAAVAAQAEEAAQAAAAAEAAIAAAAAAAGVQPADPVPVAVQPAAAEPAAVAADPALAALQPAAADPAAAQPAAAADPQPAVAAVPAGACPDNCHADVGYGRCEAGRCICALGRGGRDCMFNLE